MERGEAAIRLTRTAALGRPFPADVPDTPENRKLLAMIEADIKAMPDGISPDVPYDYSGGFDGPDEVVKGASDPGDPNPVEAEHVYNQLLANYPPKAIAWVHDARWIGPVAVDPGRVDTDDEDSWAASHQPERVKHFVKNLKKGKPVKPGVCVQESGQQTVKVIDGHHRYLAARKVGKPYMAYVGFVDSDGGPWDEAHSSQFHSGSDPKNKSAQTAELSTVHKPLGTGGLWGDKASQLPAYIQNVAHALIRDGHDESSAIAMAIGTVKRWAAGGGKVTPEVQAAAGAAVAEWEKLKAEHNKTKAVATVDVGKVGPHGYIHGWIFVGVPGMDDEVRHPEHGKGTITAHDAKHVTVAFKNGKVHTFAVHRAPNEQGHFSKRGDLEHELGHRLHGEPEVPEAPQESHGEKLGKKLLAGELDLKDLTDSDLHAAREGLHAHHAKVGIWTEDEDHIDSLRMAVQREIYARQDRKLALDRHTTIHSKQGAAAYGALYHENADPGSRGLAKLARMKDQMDRMPPEHHAIIRDYMAQGDARVSGIHLGNLPVAEVPHVGAEYAGLVSKDGRAFAGPGREVGGFWSPNRRHVVMDTGSVLDGSYAMAAHELGHALDQAYGTKRSGVTVAATSLPDFQAVYKKMTKDHTGTARKMNPYYTGAISNGPKEVFAEGYAVWSQRRASKTGDEAKKWDSDDVHTMAHQFGMDPRDRGSTMAIRSLLKYFDQQHQNILADTYGADSVQHLPKETTR